MLNRVSGKPGLLHFKNDVWPYWKWGNSPDDPTSLWERMTGTYKGPIPKEGCK
jgi:hypothetical protein